MVRLFQDSITETVFFLLGIIIALIGGFFSFYLIFYLGVSLILLCVIDNWVITK